MKTSMKFIIGIGIAFILIGGVFCGAAYAFGERYVDSKQENRSESYDASSVSRIDITENVANIKLLKNNSAKDEILVEAENIISENFKCGVSGNTLKISYNTSTLKFGFISLPSFIFDPNMNNTKSPVIKIYIPEGHIFDEVYFNGGVGETDVEDINTDAFIIRGGVGNYDVKKLTAGSFRIDGGVGDIKIAKAVINGRVEINGGVGNTAISGQIYGDIKINGGVGNINLDLSGNTADYNVNAKGGLGDIKLNGTKATEFQRSPDGKYDITVDGGVGNINIDINTAK